MSENINQLISDNDLYKQIIRAVHENPYGEKKDVFRDLTVEPDELDHVLNKLESNMIILSLTSKADSNIESRVPKKVYLLNPDLENEVNSLL